MIAYDVTGMRLNNMVIEQFKAGWRKDLAPQFSGGVAEHIPFGFYRLRAYVGGFYPEERSFTVNQPQMTTVLKFRVGGVD